MKGGGGGKYGSVFASRGRGTRVLDVPGVEPCALTICIVILRNSAEGKRFGQCQGGFFPTVGLRVQINGIQEGRIIFAIPSCQKNAIAQIPSKRTNRMAVQETDRIGVSFPLKAQRLIGTNRGEQGYEE